MKQSRPGLFQFYFLLSAFCCFFCLAAQAATHPYLFSASQINELAQGGPDWLQLKQTCDTDLNAVIGGTYGEGNYEGWGWRTELETYAQCYLVAEKIDPADVTKYGEKGLGLAKILSRHMDGLGYFENYQFAGLGDGNTTSFPLPMTPMPGTPVLVMRAPVTEVPVTYNGVEGNVQINGSNVFVPILRVSDTPGGPANYASTDYQMEWRDPADNNVWVLRWITNHHPAAGATYYVKVPTFGSATTSFSITNNAVVFPTAPTASEAVFVQFISDHYEQTGNFLGGLNAAQEDGPGYSNRTYGVGLAEAYDAFYDFPEFTSALKQEFYNVQNARLDWYKQWGYENVGDIGNYYIESFLEPVMFTGYGTQPENPRAAEWQGYTLTLSQSTIGALQTKIPSGYGPQGEYTAGTFLDLLNIFTLLKNVGGPDYLSGLAWTNNLIPALIHGTKPDRVMFYDGGDWSTLPAAANLLSSIAQQFIQDMPNHPMVPYARQWLQDIGIAPPSGSLTDYKTSFPLSYRGQISGPVYARSDWSSQAVWMSMVASPELADHQHKDQGHFTLQRGTDYLIQNGGGYGIADTLPWHNTFGFDDRGAGDISTYPPGQGYWGFPYIDKFLEGGGWMYTQSNYSDAYIKAFGGTGAPNSVKKAVRSLLFLRRLGLIILHDQNVVTNPNVKQIFNMNLAGFPTQSANIFTMTQGASKLFIKQAVLPSPAMTTLAALTSSEGVISTNYQVTFSGQPNAAFLHVLQAVDKNTAAMTPTTVVASPDGAAEGIEVTDASTQRVFLFAERDNPFIPGAVAYSPSLNGSHEDLITDLRPSFSYNVTVTAGNTALLSSMVTTTNQGTLLLDYSNPGSATVVIAPTNQPALSLIKTVDHPSPTVGDPVTYSITYTNYGTVNAQQVVMTDSVDPTVKIVPNSVTGGGVLNGNLIQWTLGTMASNATGTVSFQGIYRVPHVNSASATYMDAGTNTYTATSNAVSIGGAALGTNPGQGSNPPPGSNPPTTFVTPAALHVRVYPNPWRSDKHTGKNIIFDGLTVGTTIKLFTISDQEVKEIHTDGPSVAWNLTNNSGDKVGSGIYFYLITDSAGEKVHGKMAVIK